MLELNNVAFSYEKDAIVVDDFSMFVKKGEIVAIQGRSGSGKSTILRLIAGLEDAQQGNIFVDGIEVNHIPTNKRNVGYVFQNHALFPHLTIRKNIEFGLFELSKSEKTEIVLDVAKKVEILDLLDRYPHEISGGQKQRVAIARSLVRKPKVLLLDEPFTAMDQELKDNVRKDMLHILKQFDITTVLVTHDKEDATALEARIIKI